MFNIYGRNTDLRQNVIAWLFSCFQGHIFAADNDYYGYLIPTIGHSVVINILNKLYRSVAHFCTDLENHRYDDYSIHVVVVQEKVLASRSIPIDDDSKLQCTIQR